MSPKLRKQNLNKFRVLENFLQSCKHFVVRKVFPDPTLEDVNIRKYETPLNL